MAKKKLPEEEMEVKTPVSKRKKKATSTESKDKSSKPSKANKVKAVKTETTETEPEIKPQKVENQDKNQHQSLALFQIERDGKCSEPMSYSELLDELVVELDKITMPSRQALRPTIIEIEQTIEDDDEDEEFIQNILRKHGLDDESVNAFVSEVASSRKEIENLNIEKMTEEEFNAFFDDFVGEHLE